MRFLDQQANEFNPQFHYLAQIALEIHRQFRKDPGKYKLSDFLIKFVRKKKDIKREFTPEEKEKKIAEIKSTMYGIMAMSQIRQKRISKAREALLARRMARNDSGRKGVRTARRSSDG